MPRRTPADFIALIDLSRARGWLMPTADFEARAKRLPGERFHLDWIVAAARPSRTVPEEREFDAFTLARAMPGLARCLATAAAGVRT